MDMRLVDCFRARPRATHRRAAGLLAASTLLLGVGAIGARASTIAYVNGTNNNVYVADSTGGDVHEVAVGLTSPSLDAFGDLYALDESYSEVVVFKPGTGAQTRIATPAAAPTQLAVSPNGNRLAVTDGTPLSGATTLDVLNRFGGLVKAVGYGFGPHWIGPFGLTASVVNSIGAPPIFNRVILYNGLFTRPLWYPDVGVPAPGVAAAVEYVPNPQHTEAAVVLFVGVAAHTAEALVLLPINKSLAPSAAFSNGCDISSSGDFVSSPGSSLAWSPDGTTLAFTTDSGIATVPIGATFSSDCSQVGTEQLVIPNGYDPAWGPSNNRNFPAPG